MAAKGKNKEDTMIRVTPDTSKKLSDIAIDLGYFKKDFLCKIANTVPILNNNGNYMFEIEMKKD